MALSAPSLFLYGFQITANNQNIQFQVASGGTVLVAVLTPGFYTLATLMTAIQAAMQTADTAHTYTVTANRTLSGGTQNRVTISTSGTFLSLLFGSGTLSGSSPSVLLGFNQTDYTGSTTYTGSTSSGTALVTSLRGYNYLRPEINQKVFGSVNVSASGVKEAIVFQQQQFIQVDFRYETEAQVVTFWTPLMLWLMQQRLFEFTPEITNPTLFYPVTLESSPVDGKGLGFQFTEHLSEGLPGFYQTGALKFRVSV